MAGSSSRRRIGERQAGDAVVKVVHVTTGLADGGAESSLHRLCVADVEDRHVVVSLVGEGKYGPLLREAGVRVHCLDMPRGRVTARGLAALWRILRQEGPAAVQTWMYHADLIGGVVARLAGIRRVFWNVRHGEPDAAQLGRATMRVVRLCAGLSRWVPQRIVCCARNAARAHVAAGYDAKRFVVIPNGCDVERFRPDAASRARLRREWGVEPGLPLLGMVGRFHPDKDHENLIAALGRLVASGRAFRVVLAGAGLDQDNAQLRGLLDRSGVRGRVLLLGPRSDVPAVMNALDVHVLSSSVEAFPNVLAEAMACGTPCVATDVGDAAAIVGETGWIVPPRSAGALEAALAEALSAIGNASVWAERGRACRARIEAHYDVRGMVRAYRELWSGKASTGENGGMDGAMQ